MPDVSPIGYYLKGREMPFDLDSEFMWQEDAACRFLPWSMFEIASSGDAIAEDMTEGEIKDLNATNFEAAKKACNKCPVFTECYTSADEADFEWTVRAGITPTRFNPTRQGRPKNPISLIRPKGYKKANNPHRPCRKCNEMDWYKKVKPSGNIVYRCAECDRRRKGATKRIPIDVTAPCLKCGELDWGVRRDGEREYPACKACMRDKKNRAYWKKKDMYLEVPSSPCINGHTNWVGFLAKTLTVYRCADC